MKHRFLSILLALTLALSLLPGDVWAADEADTDTKKTISNVTYEKENGKWTVTGYVGGSLSGRVVIPSEIGGVKVTKIAKRAFTATAITEAILPDSITEIGEAAFSGSKLTEVSFPDSLTTIGMSAFSACPELKSIVIPGSVTTIDDKAFASCAKLESVIIRKETGKSITIGDSVFIDNPELKYVFLPVTATKIGSSIFMSDKSLVHIHCGGTWTDWTSTSNNRLTNSFVTEYLKTTTVDGENKEVAPYIHFRAELTTKYPEKVISCDESIPAATESDNIVCKEVGCADVTTVTRQIPRLDHKPKETDAVAATCETPGHGKGSVCSVCGKVLSEGEVISALGHTYKNSNWSEEETVQGHEADCENGTPRITISVRLCDTCKKKVVYDSEELKKDIEDILKKAEEKPTAGDAEETSEKEYKELELTYSHEIENVKGTNTTIKVYKLKVTPASHTPGEILKIEQGSAPEKYNCEKGGSGYKVTYECKECGKEYVDNNATIEKGKHVQGDDATAVVEEPTCSKEGLKTITSHCKVCGIEFTEKIILEKTEHTPGEPTLVGSTATCTTPGVETYITYCTVCKEPIGEPEKREVTATHKWEKDPNKEDIAASCKDGGEGHKYFKCTVCGETKEEVIPKLPHEYGEEEVDESKNIATCTEDGIITVTKKCKNCDHVETEEKVGKEATGHEPLAPEKVEVIKEATCTEEGSAVYHTSCKVCKLDLQDTKVSIPALGHDFGPWTTSGSTRTRTCKREGCGYKETDASTTPSNPSDPSKPSNPGTSANTYYSVDVIRPANGSISVSTSRALANTRVTVTLRPNAGYQLDSVRVNRSGSGKSVALSGNGSNRYTFVMPASRVEVRAVFSTASGSSSNTTPPNDRNTNPTKNIVVNIPQISSAAVPAGSRVFVDVPSTFWAQGEIIWACQRGFVSGSGGNFYPDNPITVRQLWMVMARMMGQNPANMEEARVWALNNGFAYGGNPNAPLNRLQLATMLYRCARLMGSKNTNTTNLGNFPDSRNIPAASKNAMAWAVANGIITGTTDGRLNPSGTVSRAHFCVILYRYYQRLF